MKTAVNVAIIIFILIGLISFVSGLFEVADYLSPLNSLFGNKTNEIATVGGLATFILSLNGILSYNKKL